MKRLLILLIIFAFYHTPASAASQRLRLATWNFGFLAEKDGEGCMARTPPPMSASRNMRAAWTPTSSPSKRSRMKPR